MRPHSIFLILFFVFLFQKTALDLDIADLSATNAPELKGKKASDYIDTTLLGELEIEGFFALPKS
jgi:hypothetical protein